MKVLFLTDSVSLPRKHKNGQVLWEEIYYSKFKQQFPSVDFLLVGMGGATISQLQLALNYYDCYQADILVLQSGIVDCAPRAFSQFEQQVITKLRLVRFVKPLTKFLRKHRHISFTKPRVFEEQLLKIKKKFDGKPTIAIGILPGNQAYEQVVPGISTCIERYNSILKKHMQFIDNSDFSPNGVLEDHHHLNALGQQIIFDKLVAVLQPYLQQA
ncbi:MAG: hypothetical protein RLY16_2975 [Bacteroidota bacterium]